MKNNIFTADPLCRLTCNVETNCGWYFKPCLSGSHTSCHISTSDTGRECTKCAICTCVWIRTDNHISGYCKTFLRKQCVLNSHLSDIKIIGNLMATCKLADTFTVLCRFNIFVWCKMIHDKCDFVLVEYTVHFHFFNFMNCHWRCNIIAQNQVKICLYQLTGTHAV